MRERAPIRLMMTADAVGGVWTYAVTLARALSRRGYEILLVTQGPRPTPAQRAMVDGIAGSQLREADLALEWQDPAGHDATAAAEELPALARAFRADIVHLNSYREANFDWDVPVILAAHSCVTTWAEACQAEADFAGGDWSIYRAAVRQGLRSAEAWVAPSRAFARSIEACYAPSTSGEVIWNGIAGAMLSPVMKHPFVLGAGRLWDKAKNIAALLEAAATLSWPVRIAGPAQIDGSDGRGAADNCRFLGSLPHHAVALEMQRAAIFISPAVYEPFGLAVLEAAAVGCALVLSDIATFRELWDGVALFVDPRDVGALEVAVQSLCDDPDRLASLQAAARARAERYSAERMAERYDALYRSLITIPSDATSNQAAEQVPA